MFKILLEFPFRNWLLERLNPPKGELDTSHDDLKLRKIGSKEDGLYKVIVGVLGEHALVQ